MTTEQLAVDSQLAEMDVMAQEDENTMENKYLTFLIEDETYGISIDHVIEIVGVQKITDVPDMPSFVKGVINLRGQVIPVVDIRIRFGMGEREYDDRTCIMVTHIKGISVGVIVDTVEEVRDITRDLISAAPKVATAASGKFIQGIAHINNKVIIIVDVFKLLSDERLNVWNEEDEEEE